MRDWWSLIGNSARPVAPQPPPEAADLIRGLARDKIALGNQARRLLDDPVLQLAFQDAEAEAVRQWKGGKTPEARERAYHMHVALEEVKARLHSYLGNVTLLEGDRKRREAR